MRYLVSSSNGSNRDGVEVVNFVGFIYLVSIDWLSIMSYGILGVGFINMNEGSKFFCF